jgi:hypothetical protein
MTTTSIVFAGMCGSTLALGVLVMLARPLDAQWQPHHSVVLTPAPSGSPRVLTIWEGQAAQKRTYWLEGAIVGGAITGLLGTQLASLCPRNSGSCPSNRLLSFVLGAVPGVVLGALVGGTIEKEPKPSSIVVSLPRALGQGPLYEATGIGRRELKLKHCLDCAWWTSPVRTTCTRPRSSLACPFPRLSAVAC